MQENPYKALREDFEFLPNGYRLTSEKLAEEFADKSKPYYCETLKANTIRKIENNIRYTTEHEMWAYCLRFNTTADYLHGFTTVKYKNNENIEMVERITGLSSNAIETLIKLKSGKYYKHYKFDYALHTLNLILATYENSNLFELIYHFLFGNYEEMGHYDNIGNCVFDGSECFISDKYNIDRMSINSELVNKAVLLQITEQLQLWKKSLTDKNDNYGKILPSKEKLLQEIKNKYSTISILIRDYIMAKDIYEKRKNQQPIDYERLFYATRSVADYQRILEQNYSELATLNYPLVKLYNTEEYHDKEIDEYIEKEVINNGSY